MCMFWGNWAGKMQNSHSSSPKPGDEMRNKGWNSRHCTSDQWSELMLLSHYSNYEQKKRLLNTAVTKNTSPPLNNLQLLKRPLRPAAAQQHQIRKTICHWWRWYRQLLFPSFAAMAEYWDLTVRGWSEFSQECLSSRNEGRYRIQSQ